MALNAATGVLTAEQGETAMRPNFAHRFTLAGDAAYATGGSAGFQQIVRTVTGEEVTLSSVSGYGFTAGAITHIAHYVASTDKLQVFVLAGTEAANAANLSAVTFDLTVLSE